MDLILSWLLEYIKRDTYVPSSTCGQIRAKHAHGVGRGRMRHIPITCRLNVTREVNDTGT